jgi:DNA-binding PadR family transcriptional regulator
MPCRISWLPLYWPREHDQPTFFILTALVGEPRHGYRIVKEVADLSAERVALKIGSLYGILDRLVVEGLVELDREESHQGRLRRYYRLTGVGLDAVRTGAARQAANAKAATRRREEQGGAQARDVQPGGPSTYRMELATVDRAHAPPTNSAAGENTTRSRSGPLRSVVNRRVRSATRP